MENKVKNVLSGIGFYGTLAVCLLVVGVCGWVLLQDREDPLPQQAVTPQVPVSQPVEMPEVRLPTVETLEPVPVPVPPKEPKELPEVEVDRTPVAAEAPRLVVAPLRGDVLTAFSMENGSPRRMVRSTRRPCQRITAVQQPENSRNSVSITMPAVTNSWRQYSP